ncbi:MAG: hypothetical protein HYY17_04600 [Planctomycetes bacterium]|nr:hypothetical protein [Planctomycetota bacterium]
MPPYAAIPRFHLSNLPVTTKVALTCFALLLLFAMGFTALVSYPERTKYAADGARDNFAGTEWRQERGEIVEQERAKPSERQIYDIVHPHSFLMAVVFFILCHMMEMCRAPRAVKIGLYLLAFVSTVAVLLAPLLVWKRLAWAPVVGPAVIVMTATYAILTVVPLVQMWMMRDVEGAG